MAVYQPTGEERMTWNAYACAIADAFNAHPSLDSYDSVDGCPSFTHVGRQTPWIPPARFREGLAARKAPFGDEPASPWETTCKADGSKPLAKSKRPMTARTILATIEADDAHAARRPRPPHRPPRGRLPAALGCGDNRVPHLWCNGRPSTSLRMRSAKPEV
jgi:hypothetical protein